MLVVGTDLIGPRSDFAGFAVKHIPYLFFTHATHKDYHGQGDTADRVNYQKLAQDTQFVAQIVEDIGRLSSSPKFLEQTCLSGGENADLQRELDVVEKERKDLPQAYRLMFADFRARLKSDDTRELRRIATTALLALATPSLSSFMVSYYLGPYYEREDRRDIAAAVYEEALKYESDPSERRDLQQKVQSLRTPIAR